MYFSVFLYLFYMYQIKLTGGSEGHADGVDDGSGSPGDGEEAARQSEDDKALQIFENYFVVFVFIFFFSFFILPQFMAAWILELLYFNRCCIFNCWCCFCFLQIFISPPFGDCDLHFALKFLSFIVKLDSSNDSEV